MADIFDELESPEINTNSASEKTKKIAKSFKLFGYEPKAETIAPIQKTAEQYIRYPGTEFLSSALGSFGDIGSLVNTILGKPIAGKEFEDIPVLGQIPTSERLHKGIEEIAGEKIRPENVGQEVLGTGMGFLGSLFGLGKGKFLEKGVVPFTKKTMPALVRNTLGAFVPASVLVGSKNAGLPSWATASATVGAALLTHKMTNKSINAVKSDLFKKADKMAENVMLNSEGLESRLNKLEGSLSEGLSTGPKTRIRTLVDEIKGKIGGGAYKLSDAMKWRRDVNEVSKEFTKDQLKGSENFWKGLRTTIDESIGDYEKTNPEFGKVYREANSLHRGLEESKKIESFIKKNKGLNALATTGGGIVLKMLGLATTGSLAKLAVGAKTVMFTRAMIRNPGLRKAWKDVFINASKEDVKGTARALKGFNDIAEKENIFESVDNKKDIFDQLD